MLAIWLGLSMSVLDSSIANVALPTIARDLNASPSAAIAVVNAYQLALVVAILPLASLGEIIGFRRVHVGGLAVFTLASLACALAPSLEWLTTARVLQGLGAAGIVSVNPALVRFTWPRAMLGRGIGLNALVVAVSAAAGPTVASLILAASSWPWLFAVNLPIGLVTLAVAAKSLPHSPLSGRRFDVWSALLNAAAFGLGMGGVEMAIRNHGGFGWVLAVIGLGAGALLVMRSLSQPRPMMPVDLLRIPMFSLSICASVCSFMAGMSCIVAAPFYLQGALGRSQVETGFLITPWPLALGLMAPIAGRLADRYPAGAVSSIGMAVLATGAAALALLPADATAFDIGWRMALCGAGVGIFQSPNNRAMIWATPRERSGGAGGMLATARLSGQTAGATVVAFLLHLDPKNGAHHAMWAGMIMAIVAGSVSLSRLNTRVRESGQLGP